eukprot:m.227568 g.227568  ORF g.227568 m.227568 type:complete len:177 (+) comp15181_c0_seq6:40-570(+)
MERQRVQRHTYMYTTDGLIVRQGCVITIHTCKCAVAINVPAYVRGGLTLLPRVTANMNGLKVLFFGTDAFSAVTLRRLVDSMHAASPIVKTLHVVSPAGPKKPTKRKPQLAVRTLCEETSTPVITYPPQDNDVKRWCDELPHEFDIGIAVSFGYLIPDRVLDLFRLVCALLFWRLC